MLLGTTFSITLPQDCNLVLKTKHFYNALFCSLAFTGFAIGAYLVNPDWVWMFYLQDKTIPTWLPVYIFTLYPISFISGFLINFHLLRISKTYSLLFSLFLLILELCIVALTVRRIFFGGTYEQYVSNEHVSFIGSPIANFVAVGAPLTLIIFGLLFINSLKK